MYWFFAKHFRFTPNQVDEIPYDRMNYMIDLEMEAQKQEKNSMKNGRL